MENLVCLHEREREEGGRRGELFYLSTVFKKELEKDVAGDTSGDFAKLLLALVQVKHNVH